MSHTQSHGARALFLHAQTPLHPGSGKSIGYIDLPIQREQFTGWPVIPGSSVKGVLRDHFRTQLLGKPGGSPRQPQQGEEKLSRRSADGDIELTRLFGPPTSRASDHAGALSVTDARILAFPVRSLVGTFAWVTSPAVLDRLHRDLSLLGGMDAEAESAFAGKIAPAGAATAISSCAHDKNPLVIPGFSPPRIMLEDSDLCIEQPAGALKLAEFLAAVAFPVDAAFDGSRKRMKRHLVVVHDDDFNHLVLIATQVDTRIAIDYERKVTTGKALFYEESLPPETLMYAMMLSGYSHDGRDPDENLRAWESHCPRLLQLGGGASHGHGFCAVRLHPRASGSGKGGGS